MTHNYRHTKQKKLIMIENEEKLITSAIGVFRTESGNLIGSSFLGGLLVLKVQLDHSL